MLQVNVELPLDSEEAAEEKQKIGGSNVLHVFSRGSHCLVFGTILINNSSLSRDSIGSSCIVGDLRWAGTYGVKADFVAKSHCSVEFIPTDAINVIFYIHLMSCSVFVVPRVTCMSSLRTAWSFSLTAF